MLGTLHNVDIKLLRIFLTIVKHGGFSAAQAALNTTQSTISTQMAQLETRLGMRLCERGHTGFRLTPEGKVVVEATERLFGAIEDFTVELSECSSQLRGELRIGLSDGIIYNPECHISEVIAAFEREAPAVEVSAIVGASSELETKVMDGRLHCGVGIFLHQIPALDYEPVFTETHYLYCGKEHPLFDVPDSEITPEQITQCHYLNWGQEFSLPAEFDAQFKEVPTAPNGEAIALLILSGDGVSHLPEFHVRPWLEKGAMRLLFPEVSEFKVPIHLLTHKSAQHSRMMSEFLDRLREAHAKTSFKSSK